MGGRLPPTGRRRGLRRDCDGEAHSNAFIDNCAQCAPYWGHYYVCPSCTGRLDPRGFCRNPECLHGGERFDVCNR